MEIIQQNRIIMMALALICVGAFFISVEPALLNWLLLRVWVIVLCVAPGTALVAACAGYGAWLLPRGGLYLHGAVERLVLAFAAGIGVLSSLAFVAGMTGTMGPVSALLIVAAGLGAGGMWLRSGRRLTGDRIDLEPGLVERRMSFGVAVVWGAMLFTGGLVAAISLTPPVIFDVTEYHLGAWTDYWNGERGRFVPMPYNFYARFPFPVEAIYFLGLGLSPEMDTAPKLFNGACVLGCAGLAWCFARRLGGGSGTCAVAALVALAHPVMLEVSIDAMIDAPMALLVAGSFYAAMALGPAGIVLTLFLFGTALATKYTVAQVFLLPWVVVVFGPLVIGVVRGRISWKWFVVGSAAAAVPCVLWLGKNWVWYGNPLEPFFQSVFHPGSTELADREKFYVDSHFPQSPASAQYWVTLLPRLREFGWVVLAALGGWVFVADRQALWRFVVAVGLAMLLWNTVRDSQNRFLLPLFVMAAAFAAVGAQAVPVRAARRVVFGAMVLFAGLGSLGFALRVHESRAIDYLLDFAPTSRSTSFSDYEGQAPREEYLERNLGDLGRMVNHVNRELGENERLLLVYEARPYLFRSPTLYNVVWDDSLLLDLIRPADSADEAMELLRQAGISHVLINRQELLRYIQQYARRSQLLRLGVGPREDPRRAWLMTPTPEDLYPPFYRDRDWERLRPIVHELLDELDRRGSVREGQKRGEGSGVEPIDIVLVELE